MIKAIFNEFAENTYILSEKNHAYIIDPGSNYDAMHDYIKEHDLTVLGVLLTHGHYDHICGLNHLLDAFDAPIYIHELERDFLFDPSLNLSQFMASRFKIKEKHRVNAINEEVTFELGDEVIKVYSTPGHTRGGLSFYYKDMLFSGDALFKENIGRSDLPTGDQAVLEESIRFIYQTFPDNTLVYPGHGPFTTIAHEKHFNPFIRAT